MILCFAIFFLGHFATASDSSLCDYSCTPGGGCVVAYVGPSRFPFHDCYGFDDDVDDDDDDGDGDGNNNLHRGGQIQGSCFPESFGGACDGDELVDYIKKKIFY